MEFGIWSSCFHPHTTAAAAFEEDLHEVRVADELGFKYCFLGEHHAEPIYKDKVDLQPCPELFMVKAGALTKQIRFGANVKVLPLYSPFDVAEVAAVTDHLLDGRYVFGYGSGFPNPWFAESRGMSWEDRHARMEETLELILACWTNDKPFDFDGRFWQAKQLVIDPRPLQQPHPPLATATFTPETIRRAGERGVMLLQGALQFGEAVRPLAEIYEGAALEAGRERPRDDIALSALVYIADSVEEAMSDIGEKVEWELGIHRARGQHKIISEHIGLPEDQIGFQTMIDLGYYIVGDPDTVYRSLERTYENSGGFGTLLIHAGKSWATLEKREESMRRFAAEVAPRLAQLTTSDSTPTEIPA